MMSRLLDSSLIRRSEALHYFLDYFVSPQSLPHFSTLCENALLQLAYLADLCRVLKEALAVSMQEF